jgi:hypothetical protein
MSNHNWLEPLDRRIEQVREETAAIKKETAKLQAWKEYCEASLDLSNQEDVGECPAMFDLVWPSWIEPDEDE